jgi:hypothetical protein
MHYRHIVLFLLFAYAIFPALHAQQIASQYSNCSGYNDSFGVQVLDIKLRPVSGADVQVTFDRGASYGPMYFTTPPQYTDSNGLVNFTLINQGTNTRTIDCNIVINASLAGQYNSTTVFASEHSNPVDISLPLYRVRFSVDDALGRPLPNATVVINNTSITTDANGLALFFLATGSYDYLASYVDGSQAGQFNVSNDTTMQVGLRSYNVTVLVMDDFGNPLPATLTISNKTVQLENGTFEQMNTFGSSIPWRTEYDGIDKEGVIVPSESPNVTVIYDMHSPLFGNVTTQINGGIYQLVIPVSDPGIYPSGVNFQSIVVTYQVEPVESTAPWNTAVTFTSGENTVTAEFPNLPLKSIVNFKAEMSDNAGNKATLEGEFSTLAVQPANNTLTKTIVPGQGIAPSQGITPVQNGQNNTQNQPNTQQNTGQKQGIPLLYIFVGVIVIVLIGYVVFHIKSQGGGSR